MNDPIIISGLGIVSAIGNNVREVVASLADGASGLKPYQGPLACELKTRHIALCDLDDERIGAREKPSENLFDRGTLLAIRAAREAIDQSQVLTHYAPQRIGLAVGMSGSGQFAPIESNPLIGSVDPQAADIILRRNVPHFQTYSLADQFNLQGPLVTVCSASAGSGIAIGIAKRWLESGRADVVIAGGGESLQLLNLIGFDILGLLSDEPCSPFSRSTGMSMGEGAAFVVLERVSSATRRRAEIIASLNAVAVSSDAYDAIQYHPAGEGLGRAMQSAMVASNIPCKEFGWIRASGTGSRGQDAAEVAAIESLFGDSAPPISSLEPYFGHTNGAGPAMNLVAGIASQAAELLPPTLNFNCVSAKPKYDFVPNRARPAKPAPFLSSTAAFGGTNVVVAANCIAGETKSIEKTLVNDATTSNESQNKTSSIVISGIGIVSPLGIGARESLPILNENKVALEELSGDRFNSLRERTFGGVVDDEAVKRRIVELRARNMDRLTQYAACATKLALNDANLDPKRLPAGRVGLVCGLSRTSGELLAKLFDELQSPWTRPTVGRTLLRKGRFIITSQLNHWFGIRGFNATISDGIAASASALMTAVTELENNPELDAMVVVSADELSAENIRLFRALGYLADASVEPCDFINQHRGAVLGEGAVAIVLERASSAKNRRASAMGHLLASSAARSAFECTNVAASTGLSAILNSLERAIDDSLLRVGLEPRSVSHVYSSTCGHPHINCREQTALRSRFDTSIVRDAIQCRTGLLESTSTLLSVAAAIARLQSNPVTNTASDLTHSGLALVLAQSDFGLSHAFLIQ